MAVARPPLPLAAADGADRVDGTAATDPLQIVHHGLRQGIAGDQQARSQALQRALRVDSSCKLAHWHRAELYVDGRWRSIESAGEMLARDVQLGNYEKRRDESLHDPELELTLADWCARQSIPDSERLHLYRVLQNATNPALKEQVAKRLGLRVYQGMLLPPEAIDALERQATKHDEQLKHWSATVQGWAERLAKGRSRQQAYVRQEMQRKLDATAIPALDQIFAPHSELLALELIALLARIPQHEATVSLVQHCVDSQWPAVRQAAARQLKQRPLHDYVPLLLQELGSPIQTRFAVNVGRDGLVRHQHVFFREGANQNELLEANYVGGPIAVRRPLVIRGARNPGPSGELARKQLDVIRDEQAERQLEADLVRKMVVAQEAVKSAQIEQQVALANQRTATLNQVVLDALQETTGEMGLGSSPSTWWEWWQNYNETYPSEKPTYQRQFGVVNPYYVPYPFVTLLSCFPAGTTVQTLRGTMNIQEIQVGDRVLSQDVETGELAFKLVLQTTERPPSDLLRIELDGETITTTKGHPFWVNGAGWRMAKQLKTGDQLHSIRGGMTVNSLEPVERAAAYNLVVADFNTYFAGSAQVLVHDNTYRKPTRCITPGLR
jgi:hypothetical protein